MYTVRLDTPNAVVLQRKAPIQARWPESGALIVSQDCQSLGDQSPSTIQAFERTYGGLAARQWVAEHERSVPRDDIATRLAGLLTRVPWISLPRPSGGA